MTRWSPEYPDAPVPDESLGAAMLYSSGTTGQPKGILRELPAADPGEPLPVMEFVRAMFGFREGMTYLNPAPLYHSAPQASVSAALRLGCTAIVMEHFDPEQWLALGRALPGDPLPDGAGDVQPAAAPAGGGPGPVRHLIARVHRPRRRAVSRPRQAGDDRLARPHHHRVLRRHRGQRLHVLQHRRMARAPRHRRPPHPRRAAHPGRRGQPVPDRGGRDHLVPRRDRVRVLPGPGENRRKAARDATARPAPWGMSATSTRTGTCT